MDAGNGHRQLRQKSEPDADDDEKKSDDGQGLAPRKAGKKGLDGMKDSWSEARQKYGKKGETKGDAKVNTERVRHARPKNVNKIAHRGRKFSGWDCGTRREKYKGGCLAKFPRMNGATGL